MTNGNPGGPDLGKVGIWTFAFDGRPVGEVREAAAEVEELGYGTLWFGEAFGRDSVSQSWLLLSATRRITVAAGIANIAFRDPISMAAAERALNEAHPGRYVLGLGGHRVSDTPIQMDGYAIPSRGKAVTTMGAYLDAMDAVPLAAPRPPHPPRRLVAALGPKMLDLAARRTLGAHPYFVPVEHTYRARQIMGPDALLAVEQAVVLDPDLGRAREVAREHVAFYAEAAPHQIANLRRLGFTDDDLAGGSDRLTDAIVAYGDLAAIEKRVRAHLDAGADHVCLQVLTSRPDEIPLPEWRELSALTALPA
ncbi:TIGR03620 family F420-dependent LLM class oxidoreductase [Nonomuraea sp. NN258]|uniref:TIGR03620 family F420-dependent LLM class oxidoreductase n=1 Tax=Nonomuraea antri TaxID=2730852 RepID=UPI00156A1985|nr:TIGR03620 family F420-dependent LLM class oxidoreductase [Nonomuraea antri]NRQ40458.1 TIGR03620 family F420-dependent LLM class oxidoreductase [Nonomuraea antri]